MNNPKFLFSLLSFFVFITSCKNDSFEEIETVIIAQNTSAILDTEVNFDYELNALPAHIRRGRGNNQQGNNPPVGNQGGNPPPQNQPNNGGGAVIDSDNSLANNQVTNAGATLGRVLFYDKNLSQNRTVACASCHNQANGFTDPKILSDGFAGGKTRRHSMSLTNARFYQRGRFFWDERAATLEEQVLMPIQDQTEMGLTLNEMLLRVENENYYPSLFTSAYGDSEVTTERVSDALAQFVRSMVSFESKYDVGRAQVNNMNDDFPNFTASENLGKRLFLGRLNCDRCHGTEAFIADRGPTNNGLDAESTTDQGVFEITGNRRDIGLFKVPSLRNVGVGAPYMHDGRFSSLAEVVEHYNSGVQNHQNLDQGLRGQNGQPRRLNLNQNEKDGLVAFLETLTDQNFLTDPKFSNPFR